MCLIIDANQASMVFGTAKPDDCQLAVRKLIFESKTKIVAGGRLKTEYHKLKSLISLYADLHRRGVLIFLKDSDVDREEKSFSKMQLRSNDPHILAIAKLSNARILFSRDVDLISDFKNSKLIKPKGKVIQNKALPSLLKSANC